VAPLNLPLLPPVAPMLAKGAKKIPAGDHLLYEPKWDGFRVLVFRDGDELYLQSRTKKPLFRYFPELGPPLKAQLPDRCVVDGELVIKRGDVLDFNALQLRLHPAASRIEKLAAEMPAAVVLWDILALGDEDLTSVPFEQRRSLLEDLLGEATPPVHLTPITADRAVAQDWFERFEGAGLDGVIAKPKDDPYAPGKRTMVKIKHDRTVDCVLAGFRWHKNGPGTLLGSMVLGLYDDDGRLHQLGVAASFTAAKREALVAELAPLREGALEGHPWASWASSDEASGERRPGQHSRWNAGRDLSWEPLRLERVVEVGCNQVTDGRFRHPAHFKRFRADKTPAECTFEQLDVTPPYELSRILSPG